MTRNIEGIHAPHEARGTGSIQDIRTIGRACRLPDVHQTAWRRQLGSHTLSRMMGSLVLLWTPEEDHVMYIPRLLLEDTAATVFGEGGMAVTEGWKLDYPLEKRNSLVALTGPYGSAGYDLDMATAAWWGGVNVHLADIGAPIRLPDPALA